MPLVKPSDVSALLKLNKFGLGFLAKPFLWITGMAAINELYDSGLQYKGVDFVNHIFKRLNLKYAYFPEELKARIPKQGPFIVVANHPLGTMDGMLLIKLVSEVRPDFKVMANFLLKKIIPLQDNFVAVNPFAEHKDKKSSVGGMKESLIWVKKGHGMGIFPSGQVATYQRSEGKVTEIAWEDTAIRLIQKLNVPVVPIYFKGRLRRRFYFFTAIHGIFRTLLMPSETLNRFKPTIHVRVGKPIPPEEYQQHQTIPELKKFLRERTYRLSNPLEQPLIDRLRKQVNSRLQERRTAKPIISETPRFQIWEEIERLREKGKRLTEFRTYEVFFTTSFEAPMIMRELSRLREITFREVGEGTFEDRDSDDYDDLYHHLFLWDNETQKIVGAYRLGIGADIFDKKGISGFYVSSLFRIDEKIYPLFKGSLEMGRAFVIKEYQSKPMPLFLLWKGIAHVILRNPDKVRYLTGCVSISNQFSKYSKGMMIAYVKRHFYDRDMAKYIKPRKEYKVRLDEESQQIIEKTSADDINKFDRYIAEVEPGNMRFPVLLKKYIKQNAKIVAFNVDPKFNNSVDGFMYIDINNLPEQTIKPVAEELEAAAKEIVKKQQQESKSN
jgi:putative hemolysin